MELVIYGAQGYALGAYNAVKTLYSRRVIPCFMVTTMGNNAPMLGGIPVREVATVSSELTREQKDSLEVLIATPENVQPDIEETLENYGFYHYSRLDSKRWGELMKMFHIKSGDFLPLSALPVGNNMPFIRMYMAKSDKDRPLINVPILPGYVYPIQAGTDRTEIRIADRMDNKGENISARNGNYSELTVLYWIWKNTLCNREISDGNASQYYGMSQYRRMLVFSEDDLLRLIGNDVDVVLPYPLLYESNIHAHHERYLKDTDWQALLTALQELQPEYADAFAEILDQPYLFNYNVILAKKQVLREYCEWLFPILARTEELSVPKGWERADRYIGYMGEILETLYFMKNQSRLNMVVTECRMYV